MSGSRHKDLAGKRFGSVVVVKFLRGGKSSYWECLCDCGTTTIVSGSLVRAGHTTSCGCYKWEHAVRNGDQPLTWIPISELTNNHLAAILEYGGADWHLKLIAQEISYRKLHGIEIADKEV